MSVAAVAVVVVVVAVVAVAAAGVGLRVEADPEEEEKDERMGGMAGSGALSPGSTRVHSVRCQVASVARSRTRRRTTVCLVLGAGRQSV